MNFITKAVIIIKHIIVYGKQRIRELSYLQLFVIAELILFISFGIINLISHGEPANSLFLNPMRRYDDYFMHLGYASAPIGTNIYEFSSSACFPPFAYLMYALLARAVGYSAENPSDTKIHQTAGNNMTVYILYTALCIILIVYATSLFIKKRGFVYQVMLPCILIFTYPVAFSAIQRGNSVLPVAALICIAAAWRNDESKVKRELALVIIAVCAGLKIYPAVLGLLYLKERRWKETLRLLIYGIVLFFGPFVFFGGIEGMKTFFSSLLALNGQVNRCSVSGLTEALTTAVFGHNIHEFTFMIQQIFLILCAAAFFMTKDKWGEMLTLCALMTVYISSSWMYTCVYIIPVALVFFSEKGDAPIRINRNNWTDIIAMILFLCVFSYTYSLDYPFIYDSITILTTIYGIIVISRTIYRRIYKSISSGGNQAIISKR